MTHIPAANAATSSAETVTEGAARAQSLIEYATDTNAEAMASLLRLQGFERVGPRIIAHPDTGVQLAVHRRGFRIAFHVPSAPDGQGLVDLPADTMYGVVEHTVTALHDKAARDTENTTG